MRNQQATAERDRVLADALAAFSEGEVTPIRRTNDGQQHISESSSSEVKSSDVGKQSQSQLGPIATDLGIRMALESRYQYTADKRPT